MFSCPSCNRMAKKDRFPLGEDSRPLLAEHPCPGEEVPLLLDPSSDNPIEHIRFVRGSLGASTSPAHWWAHPRNGSRRGAVTIETCGLNNAELRELREVHYETVILPHVGQLERSLKPVFDADQFAYVFQRALGLLDNKGTYVGLTYDALRDAIPNEVLAAVASVEWPPPEAICSTPHSQ